MPLPNAELIRNAFLTSTGADPNDVRESILVRHELYCGRQWKAGDYSLIWFAEESQVKFYGPARQLIFSGDANAFLQGLSEKRRAA